MGCLLAWTACRSPGVSQQGAADLVAVPTTLTLPDTYLGEQTVGHVDVTNRAGAVARGAVTVTGPFAVSPQQLELAAGESVRLDVTFTPTAAGPVSGVLEVGALVIPVDSAGLEVPACLPSGVCVDAHFDDSSAQCVQAPKIDGTTCETRCLTGACAAGVCTGTVKGCDDHDACTVDACDELNGCSHPKVQCPTPSQACQVATCDPATGCGVQSAVDGTLCGPDDCLSTQVEICIQGQCVQRARPQEGRCANRWVPTSIPARYQHTMAFDHALQRVVTFGGAIGGVANDTWDWDGTTWAQHTPVASPPARYFQVMTSDSSRQRLVLFGGYGTLGVSNDTWEWDGVTWVLRVPLDSPSSRFATAMAYDASRKRVVLFGGLNCPADTWEWDGTDWLERHPAHAPSPRYYHAMVYDDARQRTVLFGGSDSMGHVFADTWEWDGTDWVERTVATLPPVRSEFAMAYDPLRARVVVFGGLLDDGALDDQTWEWDGTEWSERTPALSPAKRYGPAMTYDEVRQRVVLFGGGGPAFLGDTWEWDGTEWIEQVPPVRPPATREAPSLGSDRQGLLLFGGYAGQWNSTTPLSDTWQWDGQVWRQRHPASAPPGRGDAAVAYDDARQVTVLFGGKDDSVNGSVFADTWEWDGSDWLARTPTSAPSPRLRHAMAYDAARQRTVLFGGLDGASIPLADTWEWDGTTWTLESPVTSPSARFDQAMAYDPIRAKVVMVAGGALGHYFADSWEWDGVDWSERPFALSVAPGFESAEIAYDPTRQQMQLLLGTGGLSQNWEWDGLVWTRRDPVLSPPGDASGALGFDPITQRLVAFLDPSTTWVLLPP